jgi:hypothetical protein
VEKSVSYTVAALPAAGFASAVNYGVGSGPSSLVVGTLMAMAFPIWRTANQICNKRNRAVGNRNGALLSIANYVVGTAPCGIATADLNGTVKRI